MRLATLVPTTLAVLLPVLASAQFNKNWNTFGGDLQRSGWARAEADLTPANIKDLKLEWSLQLNNQSKQLNSLTVPLVRGPLITSRGFKEVAVVAGASDKIFVIDTDTGKVYWEKTMQTTPPANANAGHWLCPNALNADPVIGPRPTPPGNSEMFAR